MLRISSLPNGVPMQKTRYGDSDLCPPVNKTVITRMMLSSGFTNTKKSSVFECLNQPNCIIGVTCWKNYSDRDNGVLSSHTTSVIWLFVSRVEISLSLYGSRISSENKSASTGPTPIMATSQTGNETTNGIHSNNRCMDALHAQHVKRRFTAYRTVCILNIEWY